MWEVAASSFRCPSCRGELSSTVISTSSRKTGAQGDWIERGYLACPNCRFFYAIHQGVPILLPYATSNARLAHSLWDGGTRAALKRLGLSFPSAAPPPGERHVSSSFSTEWEYYDYGPTLWTASTTDRKLAFRGECGLSERGLEGRRFCEIGCGLGILTNDAAETFGADAWGMDISTSVFRAAKQFAANRRSHFVQASIHHPPFPPEYFDFVYSHGVLHHTYDCRRAVKQAISLLQSGGTIYIWLYSLRDVYVSIPRRVAYWLECASRPVIARLPQQLASVVLLPLVPVYQWASARGIEAGTHTRRYTAKEAMHAARDRFTPLFASRHEIKELSEWFSESGLVNLQRVMGSDVPPSWAIAMEQNTALRGYKRAKALGG